MCVYIITKRYVKLKEIIKTIIFFISLLKQILNMGICKKGVPGTILALARSSAFDTN